MIDWYYAAVRPVHSVSTKIGRDSELVKSNDSHHKAGFLDETLESFMRHLKVEMQPEQ